MDGRTGRSMDAGYAIPGGFPAYPEPPRPSSRPATARDSEAETMSVSRTTSMPIPPKGILKKAKPPPPPPRPQDPLAARFYRIPRPEQMHPLSPPESPTYPSDNNSYSGDFDTDSQSTSSNLSSNTQATSVISDAPSKPSRPSTLVRHVRHAPLHTNRVRSRPRSSKAPSESGRSSVSKSSVGKSSAHSTKSKRTIHIQFVPSTTNTATANTAVPRNSPSQSKELQLARRPDRSLVRKLEQLESETETLRRDLDDASTQLTTRGQQNMEIVRALNLERNTKELILRDLHEQRRISDDFRVDFQLQQDELRKVEKDRDSLRYSRDKLEKQVAMLERELAERDADRHHHEDELRHDIDVLESTTTNLERQVDSRDRELREVLIERDTAWDESRRLQAQVKALETDRVPFKKFREAMDEKESLRGQINNARGEKAALDEKVRGIEQEIEVLKRKIAELEHDKQALESDKQALESDKRALQSDKEALQSDKQALESDKQALEKDNWLEKAGSDILRKQLDAAESEKRELKIQLDAAKADRDDLVKKLDNAKYDLGKQLETTKGDLEERLESSRRELERQVTGFRAELSDKQTQIDGLTAEVGGSKEANFLLASQRLELDNQLTEVRANLVNMESELSELRVRNSVLETDKEQLITRTVDFDKVSDDLSKLRRKNADLEARTRGLEADVHRYQDTTRTLRDEKEGLAARLKAVEQNSEISRLESSFRELEDRFSTLDREKAGLRTEADKVSQLAQEKAELEAKARGLQAEADQVATLKLEKLSLEAKVAELRAEAAKVPGLADQVQSLLVRLDVTSEQLNSANDRAVELLLHKSQVQQPSSSCSGHSRSKSRSSSRAPSHKRSQTRSPSSSLIFVRNPADKSGVYVTTRDALRTSSSGSD